MMSTTGFFVTLWINMSPVKNILVCSVIYIGIICSGILFPLLYTQGRRPYKLNYFKPLLKKKSEFFFNPVAFVSRRNGSWFVFPLFSRITC